MTKGVCLPQRNTPADSEPGLLYIQTQTSHNLEFASIICIRGCQHFFRQSIHNRQNLVSQLPLPPLASGLETKLKLVFYLVSGLCHALFFPGNIVPHAYTDTPSTLFVLNCFLSLFFHFVLSQTSLFLIKFLDKQIGIYEFK